MGAIYNNRDNTLCYCCDNGLKFSSSQMSVLYHCFTDANVFRWTAVWTLCHHYELNHWSLSPPSLLTALCSHFKRSKSMLMSDLATLLQGVCTSQKRPEPWLCCWTMEGVHYHWANMPPCDGWGFTVGFGIWKDTAHGSEVSLWVFCLFGAAGWMHGPWREVMWRHKQFVHQHHPPDSTTTASWLPPLWLVLPPGPPHYPSLGINRADSDFTM